MAALVAMPTPTMRFTIIVSPTRPTIGGSLNRVRAPSATEASTPRTVVGSSLVTALLRLPRSVRTLSAVSANSAPVTSRRSVVPNRVASRTARAGPSTVLACSVPWMTDWARTMCSAGTNRGRVVSIAMYAWALARDMDAARTLSVTTVASGQARTATKAAAARSARTLSAIR